MEIATTAPRMAAANATKNMWIAVFIILSSCPIVNKNGSKMFRRNDETKIR